MNIDALTVYLRDHLAGSELARAMLGRVTGGPDGAFFSTLDQEIAEDQDALRRLIEHLGSEESVAKKAVAWLSEKFTRVKLTNPEAPLERFEFLEVLLLGVRGKQALWEALADGLDPAVLPENFPLAHLIERACSQLKSIEERRRQAFREFARAAG